MVAKEPMVWCASHTYACTIGIIMYIQTHYMIPTTGSVSVVLIISTYEYPKESGETTAACHNTQWELSTEETLLAPYTAT